MGSVSVCQLCACKSIFVYVLYTYLPTPRGMAWIFKTFVILKGEGKKVNFALNF